MIRGCTDKNIVCHRITRSLTIRPLPEILGLIAARGYQGFICAEWEKKWRPEIEEPEIALPQHARVLRKWMAGEMDRA